MLINGDEILVSSRDTPDTAIRLLTMAEYFDVSKFVWDNMMQLLLDIPGYRYMPKLYQIRLDDMYEYSVLDGNEGVIRTWTSKGEFHYITPNMELALFTERAALQISEHIITAYNEILRVMKQYGINDDELTEKMASAYPYIKHMTQGGSVCCGDRLLEGVDVAPEFVRIVSNSTDRFHKELKVEKAKPPIPDMDEARYHV